MKSKYPQQIQDLHHALEQLKEHYFSKNAINYNQFKTGCEEAIDIARPILEKDWEWKEFLIN